MQIVGLKRLGGRPLGHKDRRKRVLKRTQKVATAAGKARRPRPSRAESGGAAAAVVSQTTLGPAEAAPPEPEPVASGAVDGEPERDLADPLDHVLDSLSAPPALPQPHAAQRSSGSTTTALPTRPSTQRGTDVAFVRAVLGQEVFDGMRRQGYTIIWDRKAGRVGSYYTRLYEEFMATGTRKGARFIPDSRCCLRDADDHARAVRFACDAALRDACVESFAAAPAGVAARRGRVAAAAADTADSSDSECDAL